VTADEKKSMQASLRLPCSQKRNIRLKYFEDLPTKSLSDLIDSSSLEFFKILRFDLNFVMFSDPHKWLDSEEYKSMQKVVMALKVVNDAAERKIALMSDYNNILTKNEVAKQSLLQVVEDNRKRIPDTKKDTLASYVEFD
jgi:hypothetical protein